MIPATESLLCGSGLGMHYGGAAHCARASGHSGAHTPQAANEYGYHKVNIPKGTLGETSKIREELLELEDAMAQNNMIMAECELADLYGAIKMFLRNYFPDRNMEDLKIMADATERAFKIGQRK